MGIKLYNKLPPVVKNLEMTQEFKSRVKDFLMQHMFYSVQLHCVSRWNVYILQKMIHGPSNVKFSGRVFIFLGAM